MDTNRILFAFGLTLFAACPQVLKCHGLSGEKDKYPFFVGDAGFFSWSDDICCDDRYLYKSAVLSDSGIWRKKDLGLPLHLSLQECFYCFN